MAHHQTNGTKWVYSTRQRQRQRRTDRLRLGCSIIGSNLTSSAIPVHAGGRNLISILLTFNLFRLLAGAQSHSLFSVAGLRAGAKIQATKVPVSARTGTPSQFNTSHTHPGKSARNGTWLIVYSTKTSASFRKFRSTMVQPCNWCGRLVNCGRKTTMILHDFTNKSVFTKTSLLQLEIQLEMM